MEPNRPLSSSYSIHMSLSLLAVSLMLQTGSAISASLPLMARSFPDLSISTIDFLATVPQIAVTFLLFTSNAITNRLGVKRTVALGLIITGSAGAFPTFSTNYVLILVSRILFGVGLGLFNTPAIALIELFFFGNKRAQMLGYRGAVEQLGLSVTTLFVGFLLIFNWHLSFLIYLLAFPILYFFWRNIPEPQRTRKRKIKQRKLYVRPAVILLSLFLFIIAMMTTVVVIQVPNLVIDKQIGSVTNASIIISLNTLAGMIMGFAFGTIYRQLGRACFPIFIAIMVAGTLTMAFGHSLTEVGTGAILCGVTGPSLVVCVFNVLCDITPPDFRSSGISILLIGCNIGVCIAPYSIRLMVNLFGQTSSDAFLGFGTVLTLLLIIIGGYQIFRKILHLN